MVRAKFYVQTRTETGGYDVRTGELCNCWNVSMIPIWEGADKDGSNVAKENHIFSKATPSGKLEMTITNEGAAAFFKPGMCFYLDFSEAGLPAYVKPAKD